MSLNSKGQPTSNPAKAGQSSNLNSNLLQKSQPYLASNNSKPKINNNSKANLPKPNKQITKVHKQKNKQYIEENQNINIANNQISSQALMKEFQYIEAKLKNRDISIQQLKVLASDKLLNKLVKVYQHHNSIWVQAARIILQLYSHYPIRHVLYAQRQGSMFIGQIILPLLLQTFKSLNEVQAAECLQGFCKEGNLNLLQTMKIPFIIISNQCNKSQRKKILQPNYSLVLKSNIHYLLKIWCTNHNSIFISCVLCLFTLQLNNHYTNLKQLNLQRSRMQASKSKMTISNSYSSNLKSLQYNTLLKFLVIGFTKHAISPVNPKNILKDNFLKTDLRDTIVLLLRIYIDNQCNNVKIIYSNQENKSKQLYQVHKQQSMLLFRWAVLSVCDCMDITVKTSNNQIKNIAVKNICKQIFSNIMQHIYSLINKNFTPNNQSNVFIANESNKVHDLINFMYCIVSPYTRQNSQNGLYSNQYKMIVLIKHNELFMYLINNINIQDNINQKNIGLIIQWIFYLALFCDQYKNKHKLTSILQNILDLGVSINVQMLEFQPTQSILYRMLISIQKCLPKYSLKYYHKLYVEKPGIFHLYFIDQILQMRQPQEFILFLVDLVQKWSAVELRDFNLLGYVCKFMLYYLHANKKNNAQDGFKILLKFFRDLSYQALVQLNTIFYQSSFSQVLSSQYTQQGQSSANLSLIKNVQQNNLSNSISYGINLNSSLNFQATPNLNYSFPPLTLSYYQQESQLKSCGYSLLDKSIFMDRNFYIGQELLAWSTILNQINQDNYYFHCKYFYHLLTTTYCINNLYPSPIDKNKQRLSSNKIDDNTKIEKVLQLWQIAVNKNKVSQIHSIFHMLTCWIVPPGLLTNKFNTKVDQFDGSDNAIVTSQSIYISYAKRIIKILMQQHEKFINLPTIYSQSWKQLIKQMQNSSQLYDNYKKQQIKIRNRQLFFLKTIIRFIQNIGNSLCNMIPKTVSFELAGQIIQKYAFFGGELVCWRSLRILSEKMSRNVFVDQALTVIKQSATSNLSKNQRRKLQLYRQLIFAYIQQRDQDHQLLINFKTKFSQHSNSHLSDKENSQNSQIKSIQVFSQFQLKLTMPHILLQCIDILSDSVKSSSSKFDKNFLKAEKQELYNKFIAVQILQQVFIRSKTNKKCNKLVFNLLYDKNNKYDTSKTRIVLPNQTFSKLRCTLQLILFRDSNLITKYERKLIMHMRSICLNWIASDASINLTNNQINRQSLLEPEQTFIIIWHLVMDEDIQLRIQALNILTSYYKSNNNSYLQSQLYYVGAILTLVSTIQPKLKLKSYAQKISNQIFDQLLQANGGIITNMCGFLFGLFFTIGFLIYNSKVSLPSIDIFEAFFRIWMRNNKDNSYALMCAIDSLQEQYYRFKTAKFECFNKSSNLGVDLKLYFMNVKCMKGWINCKQKIENIQLEDKSQIILRNMRYVIAENNKNVKFLKVKRDVYFDVEQLLGQERMEILYQISQSERKSKQFNVQEIGFVAQLL